MKIGFTPIPHALQETLAKIGLSDYESRIIRVVERQTFGWDNKEWDRISYSQFQKKTGIKDKSSISRTIKKLLERNILEKQSLGEYKGFRLKIQAEFKRWIHKQRSMLNRQQLPNEQQLAKESETVSNSVNQQLANQPPTIETIQEKDTINMSHSESMSGLIAEFISDWNTIITSTRISKIRQITGGKRLTQLKAQLKDDFFLKYYREALKKVNVDNFCNGYEGNRKWTADVKWFTRASVVEEIMEWSESRTKCNSYSDIEGEFIEPNRTHVNY